MVSLRILLVDDEPNMLESLGDVLTREGHRVLKATDGQGAMQIADQEEIDLVITDLKMPGTDGIALLKELRRKACSAEVIIMTGYGTIDSAVEAIKHGAFHYMMKPFRPRLILNAVRKVAEQKSVLEEHAQLNELLAGREGQLIASSTKMRAIVQQIRTVAATDSTVLITGESGTGKELVAHAIHYLSKRRDRPMIKVSCASLPETLLESELFGHERGAFTSATYKRRGRFELADGGTLFLDEIGDISAAVQAKLVRVLETHEFERLGGTETLTVDVRLIAATHKDLEKMVAAGTFREDLYYRINVVPIHLPPLRERKEDIPDLARYFLRVYTSKTGKHITDFEPEAMEALCRYTWPGNVRELRNYIERAVLFCKGTEISLADLPDRVTGISKSGGAIPTGIRTIREAEATLIRNVLKEANWNLSRAAEILGISRGTLYNKMERYSIRRPRSRGSATR